MTSLQALSQHCPEETEKNYENLGQESQPPGQELKQGLLKYIAGVLTTQPEHSVIMFLTFSMQYFTSHI